MPTIKRVMDAAIVAMVVADLVLTGIFLRRAEPAKFVNHQPAAASEKLNAANIVAATDASARTASTNQGQDVSAAMFLLLRAGAVTSEVFDCPSTQPSASDYGGGANTAQNWANWNSETSTTTVKESYSYENPYPAAPSSSKP